MNSASLPAQVADYSGQNCSDGKLVLAVGTRDTDDYYPWFEAVFHPDNMACNIGK